jgi:hypothetical protein
MGFAANVRAPMGARAISAPPRIFVFFVAKGLVVWGQRQKARG